MRGRPKAELVSNQAHEQPRTLRHKTAHGPALRGRILPGGAQGGTRSCCGLLIQALPNFVLDSAGFSVAPIHLASTGCSACTLLLAGSNEFL